MKQILLFFALFATSLMSSQEVTHVDFDANNPDIGFSSWNNSSTFLKVPNPTGASDAANVSPFVGQFTAGTSDWGQDNGIGIGVIDANNVFTSPFDLTALNYFKMKVYALEEVSITFHLENAPDWGNNVEATATVSAAQTGQWVELTFDFSGVTNIWMNNIVIIVDGPAWTTDDFLFFDDIIGPEMYTTPGIEYNPLNLETEVSIGANLDITTNDNFYDAGAATITDLTGKVALRLGDINGTDIPFTASINGDNNITIDPDTDLDYLTTYWYGIIDNTIYYSNGTSVTGVSASFTTKEEVVGPIDNTIITFEGGGVVDPGNAEIGTLNDGGSWLTWSGALFDVIDSSTAPVGNTSTKVGEFSHAGNNWWAAVKLERDDFIDFSETPYWRVKIWSQDAVMVMMKFEGDDAPEELQYQMAPEEAGQWVEIVYNFSHVTKTGLKHVLMFFDPANEQGNAQGTKFYFDDINKSNIPPAASNTLNPADAEVDVVQYSKLTINSNFELRNIDDSAITDINTVVELRENDSNGALVPFQAVLTSNNTTITMLPNAMLTTGATYWYGIKEGLLEYEATEEVVTGVSATFTCTTDALPQMQVYNDFDGTNVCTESDTMGDPAGAFNLTAMDPDPASPTNTVMQWDKGGSWGGWERIHFQLNAPYNAAMDDIFSFRVYSPVTTGIRFKLADAKDDFDQTGFYETDEEIIFANKWQTVYLNTSDLADTVNFDHLFIFLGRGSDGNNTFYIDDMKGPHLQGTASLEDFNTTEVYLYPNPANNLVHIKNVNGKKDIRIFDINGRLINELQIDSNEISIEHLRNGLYFLEINGQVKKLIKK